MKPASLLLVLTFAIQTPSAFSQLLISQFLDRISLSLNPSPHQAPINHPLINHPPINHPPNFAMPSPSASSSPPSSILLSDTLTRERSINIFASFTRSITSISTRLDSPTQPTTLLAPLNSSLQSLGHKPWEDPSDYSSLGANAYEGSDGEDRAQGNLRRFVEAHVVPVSPWEEGKKVRTVGGGEVWWEGREGGRVIQPGGVEVVRVASRVANGEVWIVKGVVDYKTT